MNTRRRTVMVLGLASMCLVACQAGLAPVPAATDPSDASNTPAAWMPPPSPFEGSAFRTDELSTEDPHAGHKGHGGHAMPAEAPKDDADAEHSQHTGHSE